MHQCSLLNRVIGESVKQRLLQSAQFMVFYLFACVNTDFSISDLLKGLDMVFVLHP